MKIFKKTQFALRIRKEIMDKMKYIAYESSRSTNKEIEQACIAYIDKYEDKNGDISDKDLKEFFEKTI